MEPSEKDANEVQREEQQVVNDVEPPSNRNVREKTFLHDIADILPTEPPLLAIPSNSRPQLQRASTSGTGAESYPEGGLEAWLVVLGCFFALMAAAGLLNTLATFQAYLITHQLSEYSEGTIGWIFSLFPFVVFFVGLYTGPIFDKYGPRWIIAVGTVFDVLGLMLFSISTELWHFILSFGLCTGFGASLLFTPSFAAPGHWFLRRRGLATGLAATGGSIGGVVFPLMLESLFPRLGWGWSIRVLGFVSLLLATLANLLVRSRLPPAVNASAHPDLRIFRNRAFLLCTIGIFLLEFALFIPVTYISSYARDNGFSTAFSYQILPILNAGSAFGRALPGWWGDIIGPFNVNMLMTLGCLISCLAIWLPAGSYTAGLVIYALIFGFASGSNISITPVCVGRLCKTQQYGRYYATCYMVVSFATLVGVPIGGSILTSDRGNYWGMIVFTGCVYVAAFVSIAAAKWCIVGWKPFVVF
ncbi:major facilitator superfamily domain-containing protein [Coniella lustricola]|uniref:Major facilitator superfamily domain-containing protein n=1 Tax=Coniella lustricola TaxID=2025994 RepID=A0A2T3AA56_9PEZI|nr:major facilitator superfamily domain-containing protein [Coniella lustricola]